MVMPPIFLFQVGPYQLNRDLLCGLKMELTVPFQGQFCRNQSVQALQYLLQCFSPRNSS